jgi:hypothetical protein
MKATKPELVEARNKIKRKEETKVHVRNHKRNTIRRSKRNKRKNKELTKESKAKPEVGAKLQHKKEIKQWKTKIKGSNKTRATMGKAITTKTHKG